MKMLFVCEGNLFRSQMAGAFFKRLVPGADVRTAGTLALQSGEQLQYAAPHTIEIMRELGCELSGNHVTRITPELVEWADKVVLVGPTPGGAPPTYLLQSPKLETWDVPDPGWDQISLEGARDMVLQKVTEFARRTSGS